MLLRSPALLGLATLVSFASIARADDDGRSFNSTDHRDHSRVGVTVGVATPVGGLGVEYALALPHDLDLALGAGLATTSVLRTTAGYGKSAGVDRADPQAAVMARYRLRRGSVAFSAGAGLSTGRYTECFGDRGACETAESALALWANAEAGVQWSAKSGPFVRVFLGAGYLVTHGSARDSNENAVPMTRLDDTSVLPYFGTSVGYAL